MQSCCLAAAIAELLYGILALIVAFDISASLTAVSRLIACNVSPPKSNADHRMYGSVPSSDKRQLGFLCFVSQWFIWCLAESLKQSASACAHVEWLMTSYIRPAIIQNKKPCNRTYRAAWAYCMYLAFGMRPTSIAATVGAHQYLCDWPLEQLAGSRAPDAGCTAPLHQSTLQSGHFPGHHHAVVTVNQHRPEAGRCVCPAGTGQFRPVSLTEKCTTLLKSSGCRVDSSRTSGR